MSVVNLMSPYKMNLKLMYNFDLHGEFLHLCFVQLQALNLAQPLLVGMKQHTETVK